MKYTLASTKHFDKWFRNLKDRVTKQKILARLARVENGHFGDYKQIEPDLYELRFSSAVVCEFITPFVMLKLSYC